MTISPTDLPPHIAETVKAIALLHEEHHRRATFAERVADQATAFVGRPRFLMGLAALVLLWVVANLSIRASGYIPPDPPPFAWMELVLTTCALFIAVLILVSQRRADRFANLREQMTLESTLLTEQKTRKIIELGPRLIKSTRRQRRRGRRRLGSFERAYRNALQCAGSL
jgi:uncharacterized membrane protein